MKAVYRTLAVFAALLFAAGVGYFALAGAVGAQAAAAQPAAEQNAVTAKVAEASALLDHYFVGETDETLLGDGAVDGRVVAHAGAREVREQHEDRSSRDPPPAAARPRRRRSNSR